MCQNKRWRTINNSERTKSLKTLPSTAPIHYYLPRYYIRVHQQQREDHVTQRLVVDRYRSILFPRKTSCHLPVHQQQREDQVTRNAVIDWYRDLCIYTRQQREDQVTRSTAVNSVSQPMHSNDATDLCHCCNDIICWTTN